MIRPRILTKASDFESVRVLWERLALRPEATVFQQFHWNRLAAELFADREEPHVIVASRGDDAVILPLAIRKNGTAALLGETLFDYRDMLSTGDAELELDVLAEASQLGLALEITALRPETADRWQMFEHQSFCNAPGIVRATCSAEQLLESHRRLGRHSRRISSRGATLRLRDGSDSAFIRDLYLKKSAQEGSLFVDPVRREFMVRVCREEGERCRIYTYETSTELVAAILTLRSDDRTRHFYTVYFDPAWGAFSPGQVLLFEAAAQTLADGLNCDFLTGEYPYKKRIANDSVPLIRIEASKDQWHDAIERRQENIAA